MERKIRMAFFGMACVGTILNADVLYKLKQHKGNIVPYLLAEKEVAVLEGAKVKIPENESKEIFRNAAYRLLSVTHKTSVNTKDASHTIARSKVGQVFYKYSKKDVGHRYITTGSVLVTLDKKNPVNKEAFARENGLEVVKTVMSNRKKEIVLFRNVSDKNDVELASTLMNNPNILSSKPNWILPIKLF